jgi:hypothetical protein
LSNWQEDASCAGQPLENFFEKYETDPETAQDIDDQCLDCPVRQHCLAMGVNTAGTGVFGGVFLVLGKYSRTKNSHKMPYIARKLEQEVKNLKDQK